MGKVERIDREFGAFVRDTRHLTVEERGAYQEILDQICILGQDENPPSLPNDDRLIANLLGWTVAKWTIIKRRLCQGQLGVLTISNGRITQIRLAAEIMEAKRRIVAGRPGGQQSGLSRAKQRVRELLGERSGNDPGTVAPVIRERSGNDPGTGEHANNQEPNTREPNGSKEKTYKKEIDLEAEFPPRWAKYPNKDGLKAALNHFAATVKTVADLAAFDRALENYRAHLAANPWKRPKNGATFFNNWRDWIEWSEPPPPQPATAPAVKESHEQRTNEQRPETKTRKRPSGRTFKPVDGIAAMLGTERADGTVSKLHRKKGD